LARSPLSGPTHTSASTLNLYSTTTARRSTCSSNFSPVTTNQSSEIQHLKPLETSSPPPVAAQSLALDCPARTGIIHTRSSQQQPLVWPLGPTHLALPCPASQELPVLCSRTVIWSMLEKSPHLIPHYFCGRLLFFLLEKLGCGLVLWVSFLASSGYLPTYHRHLVLSFHIQNLHTYNNTAASLPTYDIPRLSSTTSPTTSARAPQP
jgi:hypothetical protein